MNKNLFWSLITFIAVIFLGGFLALGWFWGHSTAENYNPYKDLKGYEGSRHAYMVKSAEVSVKMADEAIEALKNRNIKEAIKDCKIAIDIFPIDAKPYILLTKLYLMTGQEGKMFETLILAGRSYPNFNNIIDVVDDADLDRIPLEQPQGDIFLATFPGNKRSAISYMFDDGEADVYTALPIFEKYGYRATIPVVAGFVADNNGDSFWGSWAQWKDAARRGFEIANHSMYHRDEKNMHGDDFDIAIDQAKEVIEQHIGVPVTSYVFPHDSYTDEAVLRALKAHKAVRVSEFLDAVYNRTVDIVFGGPYFSLQSANRLVDIGIKRRLWIIAKCHGVTKKRTMRSFKSITPELLEGNLAYIHSKSDEIWVDTFYHVFNYLQERAQSTVETKTFSINSVDFILHRAGTEKLSIPLTVVVKIPQGVNNIHAQEDGHQLKAFICGPDQACVDVNTPEQLVHLSY